LANIIVLWHEKNMAIDFGTSSAASQAYNPEQYRVAPALWEWKIWTAFEVGLYPPLNWEIDENPMDLR